MGYRQGEESGRCRTAGRRFYSSTISHGPPFGLGH